jgi:type IV pilus assembly protein PilQ
MNGQTMLLWMSGRSPSSGASGSGGEPMRTGFRSLKLALTLGLGGVLLTAQDHVSAQDLNLNEVKVVAGETTQVLLYLSDVAQGSAVSTFTLEDPNRLVIDIADTTANMEVTAVEGDGVLVDRAEVVSFDDGTGLTTRITLYLNRSASEVQPQVATDGAKVTLSLPIVEASDDPVGDALEPEGEWSPSSADFGSRELSGPDTLVGGKTVSTLDFKVHPDNHQVVIGLSGTYDYTITQPSDSLIVVDVPGAFVPKSLRRPLDTGEFISPVRMVRAYKTGSGARVAISLRRNVKFKHTVTGAGVVVIDLAVPVDMQDQREESVDYGSGVSPSRPEGGGNAYAEEVVIGGDGRSVSPSATWDRVGVNDPSSSFSGAAGFMFDASSSSSMPFSGRRISLDFVNADIHSIFRLISHVSRLNIVASDDVQGQVTVRMTDVPWDMALAAVLQSKGLGSQRFGNIVRVAPIETIKSEQQAALEAKRAIIEMQDLALLVIPLNYVQANDLQMQVEALLSTRGSIQVDVTSNQLVIQETEKRLAQIRELIRYLDRQTPQVLIEARIVEANSNAAQAMGVQWGSEVDATTRTGYGTGLFFPSGVGVGGAIGRQAGAQEYYQAGTDALMVDMGAEAANSGVAFNLGSSPGLVDLDARLSALETDGFGKVISQPRITTLDNKVARIAQGQRIPFLSTSAGGTNVQFIEAELSLMVTPHITTDDKIFLAVNVTNNRADFSQLVQGNPAIQTKEVATELLVADGDTTVMGGVFSTEHSYSQDRVPGFSKIPLVGYLFKNSAEALSRNELLVFLTPHIVTRPQRGSN